MVKKVKKGNQNPTLSRILPFRKSKYKEAIEIYEKSGNKVQKWQENLLKAILSTNKDDLWVHTKFGYSVPRRNGKSEILLMRELYGLFNGEKVNHTAHRTTTSHNAWEKLCMILDKSGITYDSLKAVGRERVELPETGGRVEFRTRTTTGGLGEGFDLLIIDEAQEYTDDQETALKYVVTDSKNPQTIMCGTPPTLVSSGTVFTNYRKDCMSEKTKNGGWAEWSVDEISDVNDHSLWYNTNPSLGTIFTERSVEDEIGTDEVDFNIQRLGWWSTYNQKSEITKADWEALKVESMPSLTGQLFVGIKYGIDGTNIAMSIAVKTLSGKIFIESLDCQSVRNGNDWILNYLKKMDIGEVVIDGASGQGILQDEMKRAKLKTPILPTVKEVINANSIWQQSIYNKDIWHNDQYSLTEVVTNCLKRNIGSGGGFGYKSMYDDRDIALMDSAILALWGCKNQKEKKIQKVSY